MVIVKSYISKLHTTSIFRVENAATFYYGIDLVLYRGAEKSSARPD